jgi:hypothetical protein
MAPMKGRPRRAYAQARVQARFGSRPGREFWRRLATSRDLTHYLQVARTGPVSGWVEGMSAEEDTHSFELKLRQAWGHAVRELAGWQETTWWRAVDWLWVLPYLGPAQHLCDGRPAPAWMFMDPVASRLIGTEGLLLDQARIKGPLARLVERREPGSGVIDAWAARWHALWPETDARTRHGLAKLEAGVCLHVDSLAHAAPDVGSRVLRQAVERLFARLFRRYSTTAVAAFAYLGLVALDLEHLRWGLVRRRAFPSLDQVTA